MTIRGHVKEIVKHFFKLIYNKQVDMSEMITHRVSYKEAPQMYQMLLKDRTQAMGVVLDWR